MSADQSNIQSTTVRRPNAKIVTREDDDDDNSDDDETEHLLKTALEQARQTYKFGKDKDDDEVLTADQYVCTDCETVIDDLDDTALRTESFCTECDGFRRFVRGDKYDEGDTQ